MDTQLDLEQFVDGVMQEMPAELQNDEMRVSVIRQSLNIVQNALSDYMTLEDLELFFENPKISASNVHEALGEYLSDNPPLIQAILEDLAHYRSLLRVS